MMEPRFYAERIDRPGRYVCVIGLSTYPTSELAHAQLRTRPDWEKGIEATNAAFRALTGKEPPKLIRLVPEDEAREKAGRA